MGGALWTALVTVGLAGIARYSATPGAPATARSDWPDGVPFQLDERKLTLVVSVHPHCPCSRAAIAELSKLLAKRSERMRTYVLFVRPRGVEESWERNSLIESAKQLPDVNVMIDVNGVWSSKFGAHTSGQTYAFDSSGALRFSGGMTPSRGHEGANAGIDRIVARVDRDQSGFRSLKTSTDVFGCSLGISED